MGISSLSDFHMTWLGHGESNMQNGYSNPRTDRHLRCFFNPLVMTNSLLLKMAIEMVDLPTKNGDVP